MPGRFSVAGFDDGRGHDEECRWSPGAEIGLSQQPVRKQESQSYNSQELNSANHLNELDSRFFSAHVSVFFSLLPPAVFCKKLLFLSLAPSPSLPALALTSLLKGTMN